MSHGPIGYIYHLLSKKIVHPSGGSANPQNGTNLVLHGSKNDPQRLQVQFIPVKGEYCYIKHVSSGKIVHPKSGRGNPGNGTELVYHSDQHDGALFKFDLVNNEIVHRDGKRWHPSGGRPNPDNNTGCVLHSDTHSAAKYFFGDIYGNLLNPYPGIGGAVQTRSANLSVGPIGFVYHLPSKKLVHPSGGSSNPQNGTDLVLHGSNNDPWRLQVQFVPVNGEYGYIQHVSSGKIVHPKSGRGNPGNNTELVYHSDKHEGALFKFDLANNEIIHRDGKRWHPRGGRPDPGNDTGCVLHSDTHSAAKFFFGDIYGNLLSPYPQFGGAVTIRSVTSSHGPIGYVYHLSSRKMVHPSGGAFNPQNGTNIVVHGSNHDPGRLQMQFIPVNGEYGYILHVSSGKIVHPKSGRGTPDNGTELVYHSDKHDGALFKFDLVNNEIIHRNGKRWHPRGGRPNPDNDTGCVLHSDTHSAAKFYFGDIYGNFVCPYPEGRRY